jgi:hypothetical protein
VRPVTRRCHGSIPGRTSKPAAWVRHALADQREEQRALEQGTRSLSLK